jgi:phenylacetate-coenzyme A ligase PaaK-like adenylate-forming protein
MQPVMHNPIRVQAIESRVATEITKENQVISKGSNTVRLIFENAHKRADINVAIAKDPNQISTFMKDRRWTALKVQIGDTEKTVYVNINSLAKRFGLNKTEIYQAIRDRTLESLVSKKLTEKLQALDEEQIVTKPAIKTPELATTSIIETIKGALVDAWWKFTTGCWNLFIFRFQLGATDEKLQQEGQLRALTAYHNALARVPAYKKHIEENKVDGKPGLPERFEDIPPTDKKNYIQKVKDVDDLYLDGKLPKTGQLDSSTGTTGEPALWMRSSEEMAITQKLMSFAKKAKFGDENVVLINTFALGLWATGVTIAGAGTKEGLTANVGIVPDAEKTIQIIKKLTNKDPKKPIVLCGYPPNIRKIAEAIKNDPDLKDKKLNLHAIVGGEGMTEELRQDILEKGFSKVFSSYGASDLDINIGYETETEVAIRRACMENAALAKELYGGGPPPMIFHYDPMHYFIETNKDGELLYTCCHKERASPRIRYNLHDTGKVMMAKDVKAILKKYGIEISPRTNLPFLFIHGREGTVT